MIKKKNKKKGDEIVKEANNKTSSEKEVTVAETEILDDGTANQTPEATSDDAIVDSEAKKLEDALNKQEEYLNQLYLVRADFDNFRRRNQNVRKESYDDGTVAFATTLLPVIDNLERALDAAKETSDTSLKEGIDMVYRQLLQAFEKRGITTIERLGEVFDPNLENAVMQGSESDGKPGSVCEIFQKGYKLDDRVLRHSMVKVVPQ